MHAIKEKGVFPVRKALFLLTKKQIMTQKVAKKA